MARAREPRSEFWQRRRWLKRARLLACGAALIALTLGLQATGALDRYELDSVDARFAVRGATKPPADIVVVGVDDVTFGEIRLRYQDWPRSYHARVLRNLARAGVRAVIYDYQFTEPSDDPDADYALYEAAGKARPVIFVTDEVDEDGGTGVFGSDAAESARNLREIGARVGQSISHDDQGGVIRRLVYSTDGLRAVSVVAAEAVAGHRIAAPPGGEAWIDYHGPPRTIDFISFSHVFNNERDVARLRGKIVIMGATAPSLKDVHATSPGGGLMSGAELQANAFDTVRRGFPLRSAPGWLGVLLVVLMGLVAPVLGMRMSALRTLPVVCLVAAAFAVAAYLAFLHGTVVLVVAPLLALILTSISSLAVDYFTETRERRRLRATFSRFVPEAVVDQVVDLGEPRLGGTRIVCTVLFCDLRGFTSFAEHVEAERVIDVLNTYLGEMSEAILDHGGAIVTYLGDGIMAVFGAPVAMDDHADRALAAAFEMLDVRLPRFNAWLAGQGLSGDFEMGIGLNTGTVMSGNVGSERRMEYAAVGDTTNTASRLQGLTKGTGHSLFVAGSTRDALTRSAPRLDCYGEREVRGRELPITIWVPAGPHSAEPDAGVALVGRPDG